MQKETEEPEFVGSADVNDNVSATEEDNNRRLNFPPPEYSKLHGFLQRRLSNRRRITSETNRPTSSELTTFPKQSHRSRGASTADVLESLEYLQEEQLPIIGSRNQRSSSYKYTRLRHKKPLYRSQSDDVFSNIQSSPVLVK